MHTTGRALSPARTVLPNGVAVLARTTATQPAVAINLSLAAGSIWDPPDRGGVANFVARVIDRGTVSRSEAALAKAFDLRGVSLAVRVSRHWMSLVCVCLAEDFEEVVALLADVVRHPTFPGAEVDKRRGEIATAIRRDADNTAEAADDAVRTLIYGGKHPYGRRVTGSLASIERIDRAALVEFHRTRVVAADASLVVVGDVEAEAAVETAQRVFESWPAGTRDVAQLPPPVESPGRRRRIVPLPGKVQADIAYGFAALARTDARYPSASVMNTVLAQYGLGGRLGESIRERQGMAYYAYSGLEADVGAGPLIVSAGVSASDVARALRSIDEEVATMAADGVTDRELRDAKQFLIGSIPRTLETNASIAAFLQMSERFDLGLDYDIRLPRLLEAVTLDDVRDVARSILIPERAAIAVAGPVDEGIFDEVHP